MMRLTHREHLLAVGLMVFVAVWALFAFGIRPVGERIDTLNRVIPEKQKELGELRTKNARYITLKAGLDDYKRRAALEKKDFVLIPFLESLNDRLHLANKVTAMKQQPLQIDSNYHEIIVETEMQGLTFKQLMELLLEIKSSGHPLQIKSLYAKRNAANPDLLDAVLQISTLELNDLSKL